MILESFPLLGRTRHDALKRLIQSRLDSWSGEWIAPSGQIFLEAVELVRYKPQEIFPLGVNDFLLWSEKSGRKAFAALLLDCAPGDLDESIERTLVDPLVEAALSDLLHMLLPEDATPDVFGGEIGRQKPESGVDACKRNRLIVRCSIGGVRCSLTLPATSYAEQLVFPALSDERLPLQPVANALDSQRLKGYVSLGFAELTLGDVAQLSVGDVIKLDIPLDASVNFSFDSSSRRFCGRLGVQGERIAIQIKNVAE